MANDFDDSIGYYAFDDGWDDEDDWVDDDEFSPEDIAKIKRAAQDANMGFTYEMLRGEDGFAFKCNKCGRTGDMHERPFPHKLDCPMRKYGDDEDDD